MDQGPHAPNHAVDDTKERKRKAAAAAVRLKQITLELASEHRFGGPDVVSSEIDIMEEATRLVKQSRANEL